MAHWNAQDRKIESFPPEPIADYPGWVRVDCGCCAGLQWGGEEPRECPDCTGNSMNAVHVASGRVAMYPGGPFNGHRVEGKALARLATVLHGRGE